MAALNNRRRRGTIGAFQILGQIIKTKISDVRTAGRATSGVRVMRLKEGDRVAGVVIL